MRGVVGIGEVSYFIIVLIVIVDLFTGDMRIRMLLFFYFVIFVGRFVRVLNLGLGFKFWKFIVCRIFLDFGWFRDDLDEIYRWVFMYCKFGVFKFDKICCKFFER